MLNPERAETEKVPAGLWASQSFRPLWRRRCADGDAGRGLSEAPGATRQDSSRRKCRSGHLDLLVHAANYSAAMAELAAAACAFAPREHDAPPRTQNFAQCGWLSGTARA